MHLTIGGIIMMAVALLIAASIFPTAISAIADADTTGWDDTTVVLWGLIGTFAVIGLALAVLGHRE